MENALDSAVNTVLIVSRDAKTRANLMSAFLQAGLRPLEAKNGFDAFEIMSEKTNKIDVMVSDSRINFVSGISLLQALVNIDRLVPTILLDNIKCERLRDECTAFYRSATIEFLTWPCELDVIVNKAAQMVSGSDANGKKGTITGGR